ncbi:hypothetical protein [Spirillospora sp. NPDC048819]|uniref:hypothetical protein n=1 Tax=Spirillospora sp. NPDC048819 TaxID=3155268 RepID=UPI0033F6CC0C
MRDGAWFLKVVAPLIAVFILFYTVQDLRPAYAALFRTGEVGTFTARDRECDKTCTWRGDYVSEDGATVRRNVQLASGAHIDDAGDRVKARDTGNRVVVYPAAWSWDWLLVTTFVVVSVVILYWWARWALRWRPGGREGTLPPAGP